MLPPAPRYESLDACRGAACLMVVAAHATMFGSHAAGADDGSAAGWAVAACARLVVGVPLFFVISGYCIAAAADATRGRGGSVGGYFARRVRRIYPPYAAAVGLTAAAAVLLPGLLTGDFGPIAPVPDPLALAPARWAAGLTLTETWRPLYDPARPALFVLGPAWTLCYEEQFYAVAGSILLVAPRRFFLGCLVVTGVVAAGAAGRWGGLPVTGTFLDGRWLMFAAGVGVYYARNRAGRAGRAGVVAGLLAGIGWAGWRTEGLTDFRFYDPIADPKELVPAFAFALALLAARRWDRVAAGSAAGRVLGGVGRYSYSLYLVHYPICLALGHAAFRAGLTDPRATLFLVLPAAVALSVVAARRFYRVVESRFLSAPGSAGPAGHRPRAKSPSVARAGPGELDIVHPKAITSYK